MNTTQVITHATAVRESLPFSEVASAGAYVENGNGNLLRVPEDALIPGHHPRIEIVSHKPCMVTKISDDPWLLISTAREMAADSDLYVNF